MTGFRRERAYAFTPPEGELLGEPFTPSALTHLVRRYLHAASFTQQGSCHLLRCTVLSWLLASGADIASIQVMLGSAGLSSSQRIEAVCQGIEQRTSECLAAHSIEQRYAALKGRWRDIGAMLELARRLEDQPLVGFLERHQNALRRIIDAESMQSVEIQVILTEPQAWELAQFLKRVYYSDYRQHATGEEAAYQMVNAGERIREALAQAGYAPR